jgi:hypothetical protein
MPVHINIDKENIAAFCRKNHICRLALFGSVLRDDFGPDSDVDVLVQFEPEHVPGLFGMARLEHELSNIFKQKVDLRTAEDLSRYFRDEVLSHAEVQYAA